MRMIDSVPLEFVGKVASASSVRETRHVESGSTARRHAVLVVVEDRWVCGGDVEDRKKERAWGSCQDGVGLRCRFFGWNGAMRRSRRKEASRKSELY
jgi:hypothetical protein